MKIRHLFIIVIALALASLGTSCHKNPEKKFYGKWNLNNAQYRDINNESWSDTLTGDENISIEFSKDHTYTLLTTRLLQRATLVLNSLNS